MVSPGAGKLNENTMDKKDISSREDIMLLLKSFYEKVIKDETIGIIFTTIVPIDWNHHIPLIADFWETILLDHPVYSGNPMLKHLEINKVYPLKKIHFDTWLSLFDQTVDENFSGKIASLAKQRAHGIAGVMQLKTGRG